MAANFILRCPSIYTSASTLTSSTFQPPSLDQLLGHWYITQTSSALWRDKRNVKLTYTLLDSTNQLYPTIDDLITYQGLSSSKLETVHGTDTPSQTDPCAWTWRGKGWLKFVSSHWEILGHGEVGESGQWMVIHGQKSIATPAVVNVYTRKREGLPKDMRKEVEVALEELGDEHLRALVRSMYSVRHD
ncbi:hypothetical protein MMC22_009943 [Lobaria immixta]|nr:hypothetical protein [Lobaria immixta]